MPVTTRSQARTSDEFFIDTLEAFYVSNELWSTFGIWIIFFYTSYYFDEPNYWVLEYTWSTFTYFD
jgi:hypothetical protein